jgi:hypothetical protein
MTAYIATQNVRHEQIDEQIKVREKLISEMVGGLYPSILSSEIDKLRKIKNEFIQEEEMNI